MKKAATREALVTAASALATTKGLAHATSRAIASAAGVSVGTVFLHFPTVASLAEAILDARIGSALDGALARPAKGDLVQRLVGVAEALYASYDREPELAREVIAASLFHGEPGGPSAARLQAFEAWFRGELAREGAPSLEPTEVTSAFGAFFSLYFGGLVMGLRGAVDAKMRRAWLEAALRRYFGVPAARTKLAKARKTKRGQS